MQELLYYVLHMIIMQNVVKQHQQLFNRLYSTKRTRNRYFHIIFLLIYFFFLLYLFCSLVIVAFLPCVEVIPEHTDRAARIKQSRVKMM